VQFYLAYVGQGLPPTKTSIQGLEWAMVLAPFDASLRWLAAEQMLRDDRLAEAARTLEPLAYSPHPGEHTDAALQLLEQVKSKLAAQEQESAAVNDTG
jgi:hypothetical protein